ncbi:MAG: sigma-70 family RNA polymerase sigma factor [Clostridiales bacterium]|nr:sigma-70 family RNA polymerase sigma factor [Clostridiales bacterium]
MKNFSLNADQKILVEKNLSVVRFAIHKNIIVNDNLYGFEYDDLYQEGCIWLCKAALSYNESRDVKFATYAEKVVTNGLRTYCRLMCGKQKHHISLPVQTDPDTDDFSLEQIPADDPLDKIFEEQDILLLLQNCKRQYTGTARLGIEAIEWKVKGFSGTEIARMYNVKPNLVGAWISRAAARLKQNESFMQYFDRTVEINSS